MPQREKTTLYPVLSVKSVVNALQPPPALALRPQHNYPLSAEAQTHRQEFIFFIFCPSSDLSSVVRRRMEALPRVDDPALQYVKVTHNGEDFS
jgi:hypothetical protein